MQINKVSTASFKAGVKPQNIVKKMDNPMERFIKEEGEHLHEYYSQTKLNSLPVTRTLAPQYYAKQAEIASLKFNNKTEQAVTKNNPMEKLVEDTSDFYKYRSDSMKI